MRQCTAEIFSRDVASHKLEVKLDIGNHRHVRCAKLGTNAMSFEIVTFPGYLVYVGDMGSYTFWRTEDMFEFFRGSRPNPGYWSEKVEAQCRDGVVEAFNHDKFVQVLRNEIREQLELDDSDELPEDASILIDSVECLGDDDARQCYSTVMEAEVKGVGLDDFLEHDCKAFTFRFVWCCYAIQWAIREYDKLKAAA